MCGSEYNVAITAAGGIERVVAAMAAHAGSAGVQECGCGVLRSLAVNDGMCMWCMPWGIGCRTCREAGMRGNVDHV